MNKLVKVIDKAGEVTIYSNVETAADATGLDAKLISAVIRSKRKLKGLIFQYMQAHNKKSKSYNSPYMRETYLLKSF